MKRCVSITLNIDPAEYNGAKDSPQGAIDLVIACLRNKADLPETVHISCEGESVKTKI